MEWTIIFPLLTTILSLLFFLSVTEQFVRKRKPQQLLWSISMFLFFITSGSEAVSLITENWVPFVYRAYYLFAALQVSIMGAGLLYLFTRRNVIHPRNSAKAVLIFWSIWLMFNLLFLDRDPIFAKMIIPTLIIIALAIIYLIVNFIDSRKNEQMNVCSSCKEEIDAKCSQCDWGRVIQMHRPSFYTNLWQKAFKNDNFAHLFTLYIIIIFLLMNLFVWTLPLNVEALSSGKEVSGSGWQFAEDEPRAVIRLFSPFHTVPGAVALIGGGVYSYISWQRSIKKNTGKYSPSKGVYNLYIAFGALVLSLGATISGFGVVLFGELAGVGTLYISETISVFFMLVGFLESDKISKDLIKKLFKFDWIWRGTKTSTT